MPYSSNSELPESVKGSLPSEAQSVFRRVVNAEEGKGHSEERSFATAWTAVKNGWEKEGDTWVKKAEEATVLKVDDNLGLVFGFAIVCKKDGEDYIDLQDDHIPEDVMLKSATEFMSDSRVAADMHQWDKDGNPIKTGSVVFAFPLTTDIAKSLNIQTDQTGLLIAMKPDSEETLTKFRNGIYRGFSIGGSATKVDM